MRHKLKTGTAKTFAEYSEKVFIPHLKSYLATTERLDIVWDQYLPNSLKAHTREKRGRARGIRRKVAAATKLPGNWQDFLRDDKNKHELFEFLSNTVSCHEYPEGKLVIITAGEGVKSNFFHFNMSACSHEEADTRIMIHLLNAIELGSRKVNIRTVDSDVIIILIGKFFEIKDKIEDVCVTFGTGKNLVHYSIRRIYNELGDSKSKAFLFFHAFTGCDTVSAFCGKGKKTALSTWKAFRNATKVFEQLSLNPFQLLDENSSEWDIIQRFVINMYIKSSPLTKVNDTRMEIFCKKNQSMENLPPTEDALKQHVKRSIFQAGIWSSSFIFKPIIPSPSLYGWKETEKVWKPDWITIPEVSESCRDLVKCGCSGDCQIRCKCKGANLPCSALCKCNCTT